MATAGFQAAITPLNWRVVLMGRKISRYVAVILLVLLLFVASSLFLFTQTDWGRERVRRIAVSQIQNAVNGHIEIGHISGDLFKGITLADVSITDPDGGPFIVADTIQTAYTLRDLIGKRIALTNVRLVRPNIVLDKKPGQPWNYEIIFPTDSTSPPSTEPGFGSWVSLYNVTLVDGRIVTRVPWSPDSSLTQNEQDSIIAAALGTEGRLAIERVENGFQNVSEFREINGQLPYLLIADPDRPGQIFDAEGLSLIAQPFRPPHVRIVSATGRFTILNDSLYFTDAGIRLTDSKLVGSGRYNLANDDLRLRLHANPVATNDLLWIDPNIPRDGKGALDFALDWVGTKNNYAATNITFELAQAKISGDFGVLLDEDSLTFHDTNLKFSRLDTRTIETLFPTIVSPAQGFLTGSAIVDGSLNLMQLDADVAFDDPASGRSHILARGQVGIPEDDIRTQNLAITLKQIQVGLAKHFTDSLPIGGIVTGSALLNGSMNSRLTVQTELSHLDPATGESKVEGNIIYGGGKTPLLNADLQLLPLSLLTVGKFVPVAELRGTLAGPVRLTGPIDSMILDTRLSTPDGGSVEVVGSGNFREEVKTYDVKGIAALFDASAVSAKSPKTSISADFAVRGAGLEPETMNSTLSAHVQASVYDSLNVDSASIVLAANNGLLTVDTFQVRLPHASADVTGTFGLSDAHRGALEYSATIDSLGMLSRFIPSDTGVVEIRPGVTARILEQARADSARAAKATEVERAISGAPPPQLVVDTPQAISKAALSGTVKADGVITGNIQDFDVQGTASGQDIIAMGNSVKLLNASYKAEHILTPEPSVEASLIASSVLAAGFALDTIVTGINHQNTDGAFHLKVYQPDTSVYGASATYSLLNGTKEIFIDNAELQFDSTIYRGTKATILRIDSTGIDIDAFDLAGPGNGRIYADAFIPKTGDAILRIDINEFDIASLASLAQTDIDASGLVSFNATANGTVDNPRIEATFNGKQFAFNARPVPEVRGKLSYADKTLLADVTAHRSDGPTILEARGTVPIDLTLTEVKGSRVPQNREIDVSIIADSLPLNVIPEIEDVVKNMSGNAVAEFTVAGTVSQPDVQGFLSLTEGRMSLIPNGVTYHDMNGMIRLIRDTIVVDSLFARSDGFIRLSGGLGIKKLTEPSFDLALKVSGLKVLDNEDGKLHADAELEMFGPFTGLSISGVARVEDGYIYVADATGKTLIGSDDPTLYQVLDTTIARNREIFPTSSPLLDNLQVNISLAVSRDFFVRTKDANVELYTEDDIIVTLDQTKNLLKLDGMLLSDRGEYRFQGKRFVVKRGTALFANTTDLNPTLQITAEYEVQFPSREAIAIQILIAGTLDDPTITLHSDAQPPISQSDLLGYLAFGQTSSSLLQVGGNGLTTGGSGGSNIVGQGAAFATKQVTAAALGAVTDEIAGEAARSLGADVLTIAPAPVSLDAASVLRGTEIQFGKYLENRTFLSLQVRPDPASLKRPGFQISHQFSLKKGYRAEATFEPRYLPREPSLAKDRVPITTSVFGLFFIREWRF